METKGSSCVIVNKDYCVYARQDFPMSEFEIIPHAPIQALILARKQDIEGGTVYMSHFPCYICAKALAAAGIQRLVYKRDLQNEENQKKSQKIFDLSSIEVVKNDDLEVDG